MAPTVSRELAVSDQQAWDLLVQWDRQGAWMPLTTVRSSGGPGVGTRLEAVTGIGPLRVTDPMTVTVWEPPRRCVVRHDGRILRGTGTFTIEPVTTDRCRLTWREDVAWGTPLAVAVSPFLALALHRFARIVEANPDDRRPHG